MSAKGNYKELLNNKNLKSTRQRNAILCELENSVRPLTAEDLFLNLKDKNISISMSTVYRVLDTLVNSGLVLQSSLHKSNRAFYELKRKEHHHHLVCIKCEKMLHLDGCPLNEYVKLLEKQSGFTIQGHTLEIFGYCDNCKVDEQREERNKNTG